MIPGPTSATTPATSVTAEHGGISRNNLREVGQSIA